MKTLLLSLILACSPTAFAAPPPIDVVYEKTGKENVEEGLRLGVEEVTGGNPCVLSLRKELTKWAETGEGKNLLEYARKTDTGASADGFTLRISSSRIELLLGKAEAGRTKGIIISNEPGSWKERLARGDCSLPAKKLAAFAAEIREPDELSRCVLRKLELIDKAAPVAKILNQYVDKEKLGAARAGLAKKGKNLGNLLREDMKLYRSDNASLRSCEKGLRLLEQEAAATVVVMREIPGNLEHERKVDELETALKAEATSAPAP